MDSRSQIALRIRAIQEVQGLNHAELGEALGVGETAVSNWVRDGSDRVITLEHAIALCELANVTLDWLYRGRPGLVGAEYLDAVRKLQKPAKNQGSKRVA